MGHATKNKERYQVAPRFTPGSPAQVDEDTARRVAIEERDAYERAKDGTMGTADAVRAASMGLRGIVYTLTERRGGWDVHDLLTDEHFFRPDSVAKMWLSCGCVMRYEDARRGLTLADRPDAAKCPTHDNVRLTPDFAPRHGA